MRRQNAAAVAATFALWDSAVLGNMAARRADAGPEVSVLGTDGNRPWAPHDEMFDMVTAGVPPMQVIVAAPATGPVSAHRRRRHAGIGQERRLHRARCQPARQHRQHAAHLGGVSARRGGESRAAGSVSSANCLRAD